MVPAKPMGPKAPTPPVQKIETWATFELPRGRNWNAQLFVRRSEDWAWNVGAQICECPEGMQAEGGRARQRTRSVDHHRIVLGALRVLGRQACWNRRQRGGRLHARVPRQTAATSPTGSRGVCGLTAELEAVTRRAVARPLQCRAQPRGTEGRLLLFKEPQRREPNVLDPSSSRR